MYKNDPEFLLYKDTLDLDAPLKAKIAKRKTLPVPKTYEQLRMMAKSQKRWKDPSPHGVEFNRAGGLKAEMLNPWERERAIAPDRSLKAPPGKKSMKIAVVGKEFGEIGIDSLTKDFQNHLKTVIEKHKEYVQFPSRFKKSQIEPTIEHPRRFRPSGNTIGEFKFPTTHLLPKGSTQ